MLAPSATGYGYLDSSRGEPTGEATGYVSKSFPICPTNPIQAKDVEDHVVVKSEKVVDVEELTLAFGALDIESEIEKSHIRTTDGSLIKLETRPFQPLSPRRKCISFTRLGQLEPLREERLYFIAGCHDSKYRIYCWCIRNHSISTMVYVNIQDWSEGACFSWIHEPDWQYCSIGQNMYCSSYEGRILWMAAPDQPGHPVSLWPNLEAVMEHYNTLNPSLLPSPLTTYDPAADCQPFYLPKADHVQEIGDLQYQAHPIDENTTTLEGGFTCGVNGVTAAAPSPGVPFHDSPTPHGDPDVASVLEGAPFQAPPTNLNPTNLAGAFIGGVPCVTDPAPLPESPDQPFNPDAFASVLNDAHGFQTMILPRGEQTVSDLKIFVGKVHTRLKELGGMQKVKCSICSAIPADSKCSTLLRHILPHYGHQHICDICPKECSNKDNMRRHKENVHYVCRSCKKQLENRSALLAHRELSHYVCSTCGRRSKGTTELTEHKRECHPLNQATANGRGKKGRGTKLRETGGKGNGRGRSLPELGDASNSA